MHGCNPTPYRNDFFPPSVPPPPTSAAGEFVAAVAGPQRLARQASKAARDVMDALDTDGSGSISAEEVVKVGYGVG